MTFFPPLPVLLPPCGPVSLVDPEIIQVSCCSYPKYWDTLTLYNIYDTCPIICKSLFHYLLICLKIQ